MLSRLPTPDFGPISSETATVLLCSPARQKYPDSDINIALKLAVPVGAQNGGEWGAAVSEPATAARGLICLFLIFFWCSGVLGDAQARRFIAINSWFGEFHSRLDWRKFPVRSATGMGSQAIDLFCRFSERTMLAWGKSKKFPVRREKPGILPPLKGCAWHSLRKTAPTSVARSRSSRLLTNRGVQPPELIAPTVPSPRDR